MLLIIASLFTSLEELIFENCYFFPDLREPNEFEIDKFVLCTNPLWQKLRKLVVKSHNFKCLDLIYFKSIFRFQHLVNIDVYISHNISNTSSFQKTLEDQKENDFPLIKFFYSTPYHVETVKMQLKELLNVFPNVKEYIIILNDYNFSMVDYLLEFMKEHEFFPVKNNQHDLYFVYISILKNYEQLSRDQILELVPEKIR